MFAVSGGNSASVRDQPDALRRALAAARKGKRARLAEGACQLVARFADEGFPSEIRRSPVGARHGRCAFPGARREDLS